MYRVRDRVLRTLHLPDQPTWKMFSALFLVFLVVVVVGYFAVADLRETAHDAVVGTALNRQTGLNNRAEVCRVEVALNILPLTKNCTDPEVLFYPDGSPRYDSAAKPTAGSSSPAQVRNLKMLCDIERGLVERGVAVEVHPDCASVEPVGTPTSTP